MVFKSFNSMHSLASTKQPPEAIVFTASLVCNYLAVRVHTCPFALQSSLAQSTKQSYLFTAAEKISRMPYANICSAGWLRSGETGLARCSMMLYHRGHGYTGVKVP